MNKQEVMAKVALTEKDTGLIFSAFSAKLLTA